MKSGQTDPVSLCPLGIYMLVDKRQKHTRSKYFGALISETKKTSQGCVVRVTGRGSLRLGMLRAQEEDPVKQKGWEE